MGEERPVNADEPGAEPAEAIREVPETRRRYFTGRNAAFVAGIGALLLILLVLLSVVVYRYGIHDDFIRAQFRAKMADMGIAFDADVFRVTINPIVLELKNAKFDDRETGEKLFFIRDARLELTIADLFSWQLSRDIVVDKTDVNGAEVWVTFDEDGNSNFSRLRLVEDQEGAYVNFKYESVEFSLKDSVVHFGDLSRDVSAEANNLMFFLAPLNRSAPDDQLRYRFDITTTDSNFNYGGSVVENIDIYSTGTADTKGAEISRLEIKTPIGESFLSGTLTDWASPTYGFDIQSTLDLTQASSIFGNGTSLVGVGNFKGRVSGEGESYQIVGEADSRSIRAGGISLRAINVAATVQGINNTYEAQGTAIAEMLTFDDFRLDLLRLAGNIRGTGTDFRWLGELQAAALSSGSLSLGGLYLSDAAAEYRDRELDLLAGGARAQRLSLGETEFGQVSANGLRIVAGGDAMRVTAPGFAAGSLTTSDIRTQGVAGRNLQVRNRPGRTEVSADAVRTDSADIKNMRLRNVAADRLEITDLPTTTSAAVRNVSAQRIDADGMVVEGLTAPALDIENSKAGMVIYADAARVARIDAGSAVLGSLNIGGVRLSIRNGRVEARSNDIDAGNVTLARSSSLPEGGHLENVKISQPVYVLEPSGRYRATADMSLGGGAVGSISLGSATARVEATNTHVIVNDLTAEVMDGRLTGNAVIGMNERERSSLTGDFTNLDISKLLALQGGRVIPLEGETTGKVDLSFNGMNFRTATGIVNADITANPGDDARGRVPVTGKVILNALNGLFNVERAELTTPNSGLKATGRFDLRSENSDLRVALESADASEIDRLIRLLGLSAELENRLDEMQVQFAGKLNFEGTVTGNLADPAIDGRASLDSLVVRGRDVGSVSTDIDLSPHGIELTDGRLVDPGGGNATFTVSIPAGGINNISVNATLTNMDGGDLLAVLPIALPGRVRDFDGRMSGAVNLSGLPNDARGEIDLMAAAGTIAGQAYDKFAVRAVFSGTRIDLQNVEIAVGSGKLSGGGFYETASGQFDLNLAGRSLPLPLLLALLPDAASMPTIAGLVDLNARASGIADQAATYNITFDGAAPDVRVNDNTFGQVAFRGQTSGQILTADLTATIDGRPQVINATVDLRSDDLPFRASTDLDQTPLSPYLAFIPQLASMPIMGTATGHVEVAGNLSAIDQGQRVFSASGLSGKAEFSQLALQIQDTPLSAAEPVLITFDTNAINFVRARFVGGGTNMTVSGTKALIATADNDLAIDGRVNLNLLNLVSKDAFFSGFADTSIRYFGRNDGSARLSGTANVVNGSVATFLGSDRFTMNRLKARVIFTSDQFAFEEATGFLGGGRFNASGGGTLRGLAIQAFRFSLDGNNVTVPIPQDFVTTGDAHLEITGVRSEPDDPLQLTIRGRVNASRSLYSKDIDLASIVGGRSDPVLSAGGGGGIGAPLLDLVIEGRDALVVRNNIADLTASVSLSITGDSDDPLVTGRITANGGLIFFRNDRYVVQRLVVEFPPDTAIEPIINLQAEAEIGGYQVFVNLSGPIADSELMTANVRSSPALPQADIISLITTGGLTNTSGGIPTLAQTGINTAAEILTDAIISNPIRRATDKLFGLNVFEIDPLISGQNLASPSARLTVGRQVNSKLRVTYSTNLSQDQNQVLAVEYRVSDRLSFVAQYEQRSLSNVTRNRDNFSFEVRFRKRF